jgi:hypothetical protein
MLAACVTGCSSPRVARDARGIKPLGTLTMSCSKPYKLVRDCSNFSGAKKRILLEGLPLNIAGSENGRTVLLMSTGQIWTLARHKHDVRNTYGYETAKRLLTDTGITVTRVTPVVAFGQLHGYVLECDGDAYSALGRFVQKQ